MSKAVQFKNKNGEKIYPCPYYPVGAIYMSVDSTNPGSIFGGTWEQIKGRFLLGVGQPTANGDNAWGTIYCLWTYLQVSVSENSRFRS